MSRFNVLMQDAWEWMHVAEGDEYHRVCEAYSLACRLKEDDEHGLTLVKSGLRYLGSAGGDVRVFDSAEAAHEFAGEFGCVLRFNADDNQFDFLL